jgi:hypothetical protein
MAWDWNKSGRIDSFRFEKVSAKDLNTSLGALDCLVTGGTINWSYYSSTKVCGYLDVIEARSSMAEDEYLIRVWYCPKLDGESLKIEIGTFYFTADLHYENGTYHGVVNLRSMLTRHTEDALVNKWAIPKGQKATVTFKNVFKSLGGFPRISGIKDRAFSKQHVFDTGETPMVVLQYVAEYVNGEVTVNSHGNTVLQPYRSPAAKKKGVTHSIIANATSVIRPGLDITNSLKEIPNRVVCVYDEAGTNGAVTQHVGRAALAKKEPRSYQNIGKWVTKYYKLTNVKKPYVKNLNARAATYLKSLNHKNVYYEFDTYYQPIEIGEVVRLKYDDIGVYGLVTDIDLSLSVGASMHVKIRKV